jgi:hypothetical protein
MRKVMFALAIVAGAFMTAGPASAQCRYIMNDVGRCFCARAKPAAPWCMLMRYHCRRISPPQ